MPEFRSGDLCMVKLCLISSYFSVFFKTIRKVKFIIKMYFPFDAMKGSKHLKHGAAMIFAPKKCICADFSFEST